MQFTSPEVCAKCGETYRTGLVRCWNCGAFTREEIGAAYEERLRARSETDDGFRELPVLGVQSSGGDGLPATEGVSTPAEALAGYDLEEMTADDDDFELGGDIQMSEAPTDPDVIRLVAFEEPPLPAEASMPLAAHEPPLPAGDEPPFPAEPPPAAVAEKPSNEGDELLEIARQQQKESVKAKKDLMKRLSGFVVYCPQGCRVRVQERHRGKTGRCPKCHSLFFVPLAKKPAGGAAATPAAAEADASAPLSAGKYTRWQLDLHLHAVQPQKLKLKADSLLNDFQAVDVGFADDEILIVALPAGGGMFGGGKKKETTRAALIEHLKTKPSLEGLPGTVKLQIPRDALGQLSLAQPTPPEADSLFGQIPVFGTGRIAVKLPKQGDDPSLQFLSFSLSEFRQFSTNLRELYGIEEFGGRTEIPLGDEFQTATCAVANEPVKGLFGLTYYEKDPTIKLEVSGWQCGVCKAVVSEAAREKSKLGGAKGKGIAKAKCPKCSQKMGSNPWYQIVVEAAAEAQAKEERAAGEAANEEQTAEQPT